ncbi:hypothetical protein [Jiella mangrovi]|uniref:hypothetical protein n=1 Tax=Jiella mangrovi TaxID=2821407 RepID=UPI001AE6E51A|nr:hypothetical protein [Jiella mangrovi]
MKKVWSLPQNCVPKAANLPEFDGSAKRCKSEVSVTSFRRIETCGPYGVGIDGQPG